MTICTSKNQKVKIENQKCKNRKFENAKIENLKNQRVLEGGECWAPHPPFACQREVPKFYYHKLKIKRRCNLEGQMLHIGGLEFENYERK